MEWLFFALLAAFLFASGNFIDKFIIEKQVSGSWDFVFSYGLISWLFTAMLVLFVGVPDTNQYFAIGLFAGFLVALTGFFYAKALETEETSKMVILFQVIPLVSVFGGWLLLDQSLSSTAWLSFLLILIGGTVTLVNKDSFFSFSKGAFYIIAFSVLWGIVFVLTDYLLEFMSFWEYLLLQTLGLSLTNILFLFVPDIRREVSESWFKNPRKYLSMFVVKFVDFLGKMAITYAISLAAFVGLVTVVLQVQSLFSILIGATLTILVPSIFKEDLSLRNVMQKVIGASVIFVGIFLLFI